MADERDVGAALLRSAVRVELLERLRDGAAKRYELRDDLACSRSTVDRNLDWLAEAGWIEHTGEAYAITTAGAAVLERALAFVETVGVAERLQPVLRHVPRTALDLDVRGLADATVTLPGEATPLTMVDRHTRAIEECSRFRSILPITSARPYQVMARRIRSGSLTVEHVVSPTVAEVFLTHPQFADTTEELRDSGDFSVYVTDETIPYYLGVLDETVQLGVDEDGDPRGLLETSGARALEWADGAIDDYREAAVTLAEWEADRW